MIFRRFTGRKPKESFAKNSDAIANQAFRQRYECKACQKRFDDLTETYLEGHHQPLSVWILCLYFMGLNLSNAQISRELDLNKDDLQFMTEHLRTGIDKKKA